MSSDRQLAPRYSATEPEAATVSKTHSRGKWNALEAPGDLLLTKGEAAEITAKLPEAINYAQRRLTPATDTEFLAAISLLRAMPSAAVSDTFGDAVVTAYRIAVGDLPSDLLLLAAHRALRKPVVNPGDKWRPSPPELRSNVGSEIADRQRGLSRLLRWTGNPQGVTEPVHDDGPAPSTADIASAVVTAYAKIDADSVVMIGRTGPRIEAQAKAHDDRPFTNPTAATLAEVKAALDAKWAAV